jgi:hypothetical protein
MFTRLSSGKNLTVIVWYTSQVNDERDGLKSHFLQLINASS